MENKTSNLDETANSIKPVVTCCYSLAWIGLCKKPAGENGLCEEHSKDKCSSCGEQATGQCAETMGLICGAPLCDKCEHTLCENGCNSGAKLPDGYKNHCRKDKQVYVAWYARERE